MRYTAEVQQTRTFRIDVEACSATNAENRALVAVHLGALINAEEVTNNIEVESVAPAEAD